MDCHWNLLFHIVPLRNGLVRLNLPAVSAGQCQQDGQRIAIRRNMRRPREPPGRKWLPQGQLTETGGATTCPARDAELFAGGFLLPVVRLFFVAALLAAFSLSALAQGGPPAMPVTVAEPMAKRITQWDEYSGRFEAVASVEVRARVSGFIDKLHFKDGQLVKDGDLLFTIDKRPFEIAVESAEAEVARTKAQVELDRDHGRTRRSADQVAHHHRPGVRPAQGQPQRRARAAEGGRSGAEDRRAQSRMDRCARADRRPHLGPQGRCRQPGRRRPDRRHPAGDHRLARPDPLRVRRLRGRLPPLRAPVPVRRARPSARDTVNPVRIRLADETEWTRVGKMDFVDNQLNTRSGTIRGRAMVENKDQLLTPGIFGRLQLFGGEFDALLIPDSAVISDQARKIVFVVGNDDVVQAEAGDARTARRRPARRARAVWRRRQDRHRRARQSDGAAGRQGGAANGRDRRRQEPHR